MAEIETAYKKIRQVQVRVRTHKGGAPDKLPPEDEQFLVFLEGINGYFFVPVKQVANRDLEIEMMALLREAFLHDKQVKLGYQEAHGNRYISAAWVKD